MQLPSDLHSLTFGGMANLKHSGRTGGAQRLTGLGIGRGSKRLASLAPTESYEIGAGASSLEPKTCRALNRLLDLLDTEFIQLAARGVGDPSSA